MRSQMVRISQIDHATLVELSRVTGKSLASTLSDAIQTLKRRQLLDATNAAYASLQGDPQARKYELNERAIWDTTVSDGLK